MGDSSEAAWLQPQRSVTFHENWIGLFESMPAYLETARCWHTNDGIFMCATGLSLSVFNGAILEDGDAERVLSTERVESIDTSFAAMNLPYSIQLYSSTPHPSCESLLTSAGYTEMFCDPMMRCDGPLNLPPLNPAVHITPVRTDEDRGAYTRVIVKGFDLLATAAKEFLDILFKMREGHHVVAWLNGEAVGAGTVICCGGAAGVYNVATIPSARHQGVAVRVMDALHTLALAEGYRGTVLASSSMGRPLYDRLGYRQDGYQVAYVPIGISGL